MAQNFGRHTTSHKDGVVVFIVGMRINNLLRVNQWLPVFLAFPSMVKELEENKALGYLSSELFLTGRTILSVQYWRNSEDLMAYARLPKHLTAWKNLNRRIRKAKGVGFYHETYIIDANRYESIYMNMPDFGLGKAVGIEEVGKQTHTARQRLERND